MKKPQLALMAVASLLVSSASLATGELKLNYCSPGFRKNHTELWYGIVCSLDCSERALEMLNAKGPDGEALRRDAQFHLNAWADRYYGIAVCEDIDEYFL